MKYYVVDDPIIIQADGILREDITKEEIRACFKTDGPFEEDDAYYGFESYEQAVKFARASGTDTLQYPIFEVEYEGKDVQKRYFKPLSNAQSQKIKGISLSVQGKLTVISGSLEHANPTAQGAKKIFAKENFAPIVDGTTKKAEADKVTSAEVSAATPAVHRLTSWKVLEYLSGDRNGLPLSIRNIFPGISSDEFYAFFAWSFPKELRKNIIEAQSAGRKLSDADIEAFKSFLAAYRLVGDQLQYIGPAAKSDPVPVPRVAEPPPVSDYVKQPDKVAVKVNANVEKLVDKVDNPSNPPVTLNYSFASKIAGATLLLATGGLAGYAGLLGSVVAGSLAVQVGAGIVVVAALAGVTFYALKTAGSALYKWSTKTLVEEQNEKIASERAKIAALQEEILAIAPEDKTLIDVFGEKLSDAVPRYDAKGKKTPADKKDLLLGLCYERKKLQTLVTQMDKAKHPELVAKIKADLEKQTFLRATA